MLRPASPSRAVLVAFALLLPVAATAQRARPAAFDVAPVGVERAMANFARLRPATQRQVIADLAKAVAELPATPWTTAAELGAEVRVTPRRERSRERQLGGGSETAAGARPLTTSLPVPTRVTWRFGARRFEAVPACASRDAEAERVAALDALCRGEDLELGSAFAALLARMDVERGFDDVAGLLETWRNGEESMYEALDRTAGSGEAVFHYDVMIDDFVRHCVPADHPDRRNFIASRDAARGGFQRAFTAWCGRRSTLEMVALACLLGPDTPLPGRLARYEQVEPGSHSMRELVELIVIAHRGDVRAACDAIVAEFAPLTTAPWQADREGWRAVLAAYRRIEPQLLADGRSTFEQLAASRATRRELRAERARIATEVAVLRLTR